MLLLFGGTFAFAGFIQRRFPPKKINYLYGYRITTSMRSQEAWDFAQAYSARQIIRLGLGLFATGTVVALLSIKTPYDLALDYPLCL